MHTVWMLPVCVMQWGGVTFLLMYTVMLLLVGCPLLMLEMMIGQYSSLAPGHMFLHLCPLLAGLGLSLCLQAALRAMLDMGLLMWSALTFYNLFTSQTISDGFFSTSVINQGSASLESLGELGGQQALVLSIVSVGVFLLTMGGTRTIGKLGLVSIPLVFMLMVTLVIRSCLAPGKKNPLNSSFMIHAFK